MTWTAGKSDNLENALNFCIYLLCASWLAVGSLFTSAIFYGEAWLFVVTACQTIVAANYTHSVLEDDS